MSVKEFAHAKINLALDVLRRRPDGYHELRMIMMTVDLCDELTLERTEWPGIFLTVEGAKLPIGGDNLICRAAALLMKEKQLAGGLRVTLQKKIPIAAGMAGGSADAAATLRGMNRLYELGCSVEELRELGLKLGADVPYCITGGAMLAEGIGEILTPVSFPPACHLVAAKPPIDVSTAFVYKNLRADALPYHPDIDGMARALAAGDLKGVTNRMGNVLETVTEKAHPVIARLKERMCELGAENALMSGSGPTVFGICKEKETAEKIARAIAEEERDYAVFVTKFREGD